MTDRIEEFQRLHEADLASRKLEYCDPSGAIKRDALLDAMRNALPALLRVARAAKEALPYIETMHDAEQVREALGELERQADG